MEEGAPDPGVGEPIGAVSAPAGRAAYEYVVRAIHEASTDAIAGVPDVGV